jgi:hypothetical protein
MPIGSQGRISTKCQLGKIHEGEKQSKKSESKRKKDEERRNGEQNAEGVKLSRQNAA